MTASPHVPVMLGEVLEQLALRQGGIYIDGTFGAGGYSRAILAAADCQVLGIDRDQTAVALGAGLVELAGGRLTVAQGRFSQLDEIATGFAMSVVDGVVLDLGVSSMQLDTPERGFSFRLDGPLDMRMGSDGPSAAELVAAASEQDLANIIYLLGEERLSRGVARAIARARGEAPIDTTRRLADVVSRVVHSRPGDIHPATRTFQALRLFINDELGELGRGLMAAERILKPGGRLVVVSFHSLEDRIVKTFLAARAGGQGGSRHLPEVARTPPSFQILTKRPVGPRENETAANPRARSAKLRAAERLDAPANSDSPALPRLPSLAEAMRGTLTMRLINLIVVVVFVFAAVHVYKIKFDSTVQAERLAKLRVEIRHERDAIAALRAEWAQLDNPARIQGLAQRHLALKPTEATQVDSFDRLPERPPELVPPNSPDPIGAMINGDFDYPTGAIKAPAQGR